MMFRGEKPLAVFSDFDGWFPNVVERYLRLFDRHVGRGSLVRRDHWEIVPDPPKPALNRLHVVLFALPKEVWRIDDMIALRAAMREGRWSPEHERREGELLGYEDWQNDYWLARRAARAP